MTTPQGLLKWGQAGIYNGVDDREVIRAVTRFRTGLVWPAVVRTGSGLQIILDGGWLGVADCGDRSSAVVGSRADLVVNAAPGPPTGQRVDLLWCDVHPDDATWELVVIPQAQAAGRPGMPLATITVPANATLASQMGIVPADATLERRILNYREFNDTRTVTAQTWGTAPTVAWTWEVRTEPGQWYRVVFDAHSVQVNSGSLDLKIGIGWHAAGTSDNTSVLMRAAAISCPRLGWPNAARVEYIFRHPVNAAASVRQWDGRIWASGASQFRVQGTTSLVGANPGPGLVITVEDIGS